MSSKTEKNPLSFAMDEEKMRDFYILSKDEFLRSYSYLTEEEYDATFDEVANYWIVDLFKIGAIGHQKTVVLQVVGELTADIAYDHVNEPNYYIRSYWQIPHGEKPYPGWTGVPEKIVVRPTAKHCACCGKEIEGTYLKVGDNFLQVKYFENDDENIFCSKECLLKSLSVLTVFEDGSCLPMYLST